MEHVLGQDFEKGAARIAFLQDNCDKVEELGYTKAIPSERLEELKNQLVDVSIQTKDVKADAKESARQYKEQIKQLETESGKITDQLKARSEYVMEKCFKFVDSETRQVGYYNSDGILVYQRPAQPDELQKTIYQSLKTGTND